MENRTVFDTNIWISYFWNEKYDEIIKLKYEKNVRFLRSSESVKELKTVLRREKFKKKNFEVNDLLEFYTGISEFCETIPDFKDCPDPKDNFLFDLAIQGNADFLVSGDKKVLETPLKSKNIKLRTLTAFKAEIEN